MRYFLLATLALLGAGCVSDQQRVDISKNAQAIYNAASSLPATPQVVAIEINAVAIANAVGHPLVPQTVTPMSMPAADAPKGKLP